MGFFIKKRQCYRLTWTSWAILLIVVITACLVGVRSLYPFLGITDRKPATILVVEGWISDIGLKQAANEFGRGEYQLLITAGVPLSRGSYLIEYKTTADLSAATLSKMGVNNAKLQAVPTSEAMRNRTYQSATSVRDWMNNNGFEHAVINVFTAGAHARRSQVLYQYAFGEGRTVGVVAYPPERFDSQQWWMSSAGVREMVFELVGFLYARFVFNPAKDKA